MTSRKRSSLPASLPVFSGGFTLIEVMVVIAILAAILAIGAPRMFTTATAMRSGIRNIAIMTRELRNIARLSSSTMRIAFDMREEKDHKYWVESANGNVTLLSADQEKDYADQIKGLKDEEKSKSEFQMDTRVIKKEQRLPKGLFVESVEYAGKEEITSGMAYVHFFPQGLAEAVAIHFTDRKTLNWTLTVNPLTGRADVFERKVLLKDLNKE